MLKVRLLVLLGIVVLAACQSATRKQKSPIYTATFYPTTEDISSEFSICQSLSQEELSARHRKFEYEGLKHGHAIFNGKEVITWVVPKDPNQTKDPASQEIFKNAYNSFIGFLKNPGVPKLSEAAAVTITFSDPDFKSAESLTFANDKYLYKFRVNGDSLSPVTVGNAHQIDLIDVGAVKNFKVERDFSRGHKGLTYLYIYSGNLLIKSDKVILSKENMRIMFTQNLLPTHFVDPYEMKRDFPHVEILSGKIHNIETIQDKVDEQNVVFFSVSVEPTSNAPGGWQSFSFSVPLLIHTTVLPPNLWGFAESYIPMNTKVYANFVKKSEITAAVVGRFTTDHLLEGEYTPITSAKSENPSVRPQKEQRLVLNTHDFQTNQLLLSGVLVLGVGMILMGLFKRGTS